MKMIATAIVTLFAAAALAQGTAAPTAPATASMTKETKATTEHTATAMEAKKDDMCATKTGKAKAKCEAQMKKAHKE